MRREAEQLAEELKLKLDEAEEKAIRDAIIAAEEFAKRE